MDIEKLIEDLRGLLKQYGEKIPYGELVGAPWPYSRAGDLVWQDPEPYFIEQAATALSTLQAENDKLRVEAEGMRSNWYKSVEEIKKLRTELERVTAERDAVIKELNGVSSLVDDLAEFVDREIHPVVDYNLYLDLRENVDAVSMFQHEEE